MNLNKIKINKKANSLADQKAARIRAMQKAGMASERDIQWLNKHDSR